MRENYSDKLKNVNFYIPVEWYQDVYIFEWNIESSIIIGKEVFPWRLFKSQVYWLLAFNLQTLIT